MCGIQLRFHEHPDPLPPLRAHHGEQTQEGFEKTGHLHAQDDGFPSLHRRWAADRGDFMAFHGFKGFKGLEVAGLVNAEGCERLRP